jgi:hypothetical protein
MAFHTRSRGAGRNAIRSERFIRRMRRIAKLVRATCEPWEAVSADIRPWILRWASVVGLMLVGLPAWIIEMVR